jgi:ATP synthase delta/epsilon subunit-like protein
VEYVEVPGIAGYLGVLTHHAALVTGLAQGTLTVRVSSGDTQRWEVSRGFFEVSFEEAPIAPGQLQAYARHPPSRPGSPAPERPAPGGARSPLDPCRPRWRHLTPGGVTPRAACERARSPRPAPVSTS